MAESTPPTIPRSSHRLEYTSCIDTTVSSSAAMQTFGNINAHSSFDFISQVRDCDTSVTKNYDRCTKPHRLLERDLRRLDIEPNQLSIEINHKKLGRTESISLPTTPVEQISSTFDFECHPLMPLTLDNKKDINESEQYFCSTSSTNCRVSTPEQIANESILNVKR